MRISESPSAQRGFSYLLLLFTLVLSGVALARVGEQWRVALHREREAELLFRGAQIRKALESYQAVQVEGVGTYPPDLAALLEDRRQPEPRYHLRRLYLDPFTGLADWELLRDEAGGVTGVHSRSRQIAMARHGLPVSGVASPVAAVPGQPAETGVRVGDWLFVASPAASAPE